MVSTVMNEDLIRRLKLAYPAGTLYVPDEAVLISKERDQRIMKALRKVAKACSLHFTFEPFIESAYQISLTQQNHPRFEEWIWSMDNPDKLAWIATNQGAPYPVLWLKISRVADYYKYFYNHWVPRGDTGYLDADCCRQPNKQWIVFEKLIGDELAREGFHPFTRELSREMTPFVLEYEQMPDDDPRWDDDRYERSLVPSTLHRCLFGN
jgi:hypothetical protein